jgi:alpha-D-xyloside xylohydrolase
MARSINRRQLAKSLLAGAALGTIGKQGRSQPLPQIHTLHARWIEVGPGIWKATLGRPEAITPVSSRLVEPHHDSLRKMDAVTGPPIEAPVGTVRNRGTLLSLPLAAHEDIYGFGLQFFSLSHRAKKRVIRVNADPRVDTGDSHAPVPFFVSSLGYGVLIDTARYATFYCGEARPKPTQPTSPVPGGTVPLYIKSLDQNETSQVLVEVPSAPGVDVYLFAGPSMLEAVRRYNLFAGGGPMPPEWGLGFWYRASSNAADHDILALAQEFRDRHIPCDVIGLEPGWQSHAYSCTFAWNESRFPQPLKFIAALRSRGYRVNLWEHAFIHPSSPLFAPMRDLAGDKQVWGGLVPDFQNPQARKVFGDYHGKELIDIGISGFKLDECDNSDYTGGWSFPEVSQFPSGVDGEQMHNLFGLRYQAALWQQFQQRKQPTFQLVRSSGALATPYPFVLYSDLYDHRQFVRALVNSSFSGLLWCPEVRDAKSDADLIRRLQTAVFSPLAMVNGWYILNPPWKQLDRKKNNANELMPNWQALESRCREIIGWRMQLVPYLRAAFARYAADGTPPFRALALDFPDQPEVAKTDDAWMVGDRMLVAPLFAGETERTLNLPTGAWHNFWTGERVPGGTLLTIPASTANIPVFVKAGSIVPLASVSNSTVDPASRILEVRVFGDGHLPFSLRTPEGDALDLTWDAASRTGSVLQRGTNDRYTIASWRQTPLS